MPNPPPPGPLAGLLAPWRGLRYLLGERSLWLAASLPFLINLGLVTLFFWLGYSRLGRLIRDWLPQDQGWWWAALLYLLVILLALALLAAAAFLFIVLGNLLAAPFLELLTRRVELLVRGGSDWAQTSLWQDLLRVAKQSLQLLGLYLLVMLPLWLLNFIPVLGNILYAVLAFLTTSCFLALSFLDYPLDRRGLSLKAKLAYLRGLGLTGLAFGGAVLALGLLPLLNLLLLPAAAVGGTLLYLERPLADLGPRVGTPSDPPHTRLRSKE